MIDEEGLVERAAAIGETIRARMLAWQERWHEIGDVRGPRRDAGDRARARPRHEGSGARARGQVVEEALRSGLLLITCGDLLQLHPRARSRSSISDAELDEALGVWEQALEAVLG